LVDEVLGHDQAMLSSDARHRLDLAARFTTVRIMSMPATLPGALALVQTNVVLNGSRFEYGSWGAVGWS
jgi:hypothetical protein